MPVILVCFIQVGFFAKSLSQYLHYWSILYFKGIMFFASWYVSFMLAFLQKVNHKIYIIGQLCILKKLLALHSDMFYSGWLSCKKFITKPTLWSTSYFKEVTCLASWLVSFRLDSLQKVTNYFLKSKTDFIKKNAEIMLTICLKTCVDLRQFFAGVT